MDLFSEKAIKALLSRYDFRFSKSLGQNFLVDETVPEKIASGSGIDASFGVLEIGPGIGALTQALSLRAKQVLSVELDKRLLPLLEETLVDRKNVKIVSGDILKLDISKTVQQEMPGLRYAVCANLPYNITTPVLTALIDTKIFESITVMVQREVARRMCAEPGTPDYGAFTLYVKYHAEATILFDVMPDSFMPQPKVTSAVVTLKMRSTKPDCIDDEVMFFRVVKSSFAQRRKMLVNGLEAAFGSSLSKSELKDIVTGCGFKETIRGEELGIPGFAAIARAISGRLSSKLGNGPA